MARNPTARRLLISGAGLAFGFGLLVAAASAGRPYAKDGGTLVIAAPAFDYIDPALVADPTLTPNLTVVAAAWGVEDATCAMLLRYAVARPPAVRFDLIPEVAAGYPAISGDGKTYTFTIRAGFRFSTGVPLTAANYVSAIKRVRNPAMNSPAAQYLQEVAQVNAAKNKLIVRLTKRVPDFPARMTMPYLCPVQKDLPSAPEGVPAPLPGSGPYYVAEFVRDSRVVLKRNPYYRGLRAHHLGQIVFQVNGDSVGVTRKVESGELDVDLNVPLVTLADLTPKYGINKHRFFSVRSANVFYVFMNTERPLFKGNARLRQAINFALDRTAMLQAFGGHFGSRTDSYLPPGLPGHLNVHPYPLRHPDLPKARALAHGHTRGGKAVYYACESLAIRCLAHAQLVQYALKQIGIDVEIKQYPLAVWAAKIGTRGEPFDMTDDSYIVPWVDPYHYVHWLLDGRTLRASGNANRSYFNSARYNKLIDRAGRLSGMARYDAFAKLAVDIERDAAPMAAYTDRNTRFFVSNRVGCVTAAAHGLDLAGLCVR
jgi:peptide/nickel transport system substrate-binding protein